MKLLKHIQKFNNLIGLNNKEEVIIATSGGVDSMVLVFLMKKLNYKIKCVHVNHHTRGQENIEEQNLVAKYCLEHKIPLDIYNYFPNKKDNLEKSARDFRYKVLKAYNKPILTAHHIDDSFEWHLMQKFKSSSENIYGIPVKNGNIYRPLMSLSKKQIYKIALSNNIPFREDSSNEDISYERNYVRNIIIPLIEEKYPNYLKHYVNQMNNLTKEKGLHITSKRNIRKRSNVLSLDSSYNNIAKAIQKASDKSRGKISNNLNQLIEHIEKGKRNFQMDFSGNVTVMVTKKDIKIYNKRELK